MLDCQMLSEVIRINQCIVLFLRLVVFIVQLSRRCQEIMEGLIPAVEGEPGQKWLLVDAGKHAPCKKHRLQKSSLRILTVCYSLEETFRSMQR
jgi:hypothetical protein